MATEPLLKFLFRTSLENLIFFLHLQYFVHWNIVLIYIPKYFPSVNPHECFIWLNECISTKSRHFPCHFIFKMEKMFIRLSPLWLWIKLLHCSNFKNLFTIISAFFSNFRQRLVFLKRKKILRRDNKRFSCRNNQLRWRSKNKRGIK